MKKKVILLIEDDELDVISVQRALMKIDIQYELTTAYNGREALALLTQPGAIRPDVILLDLSMPKMNGFEFLKTLRDDINFRDTKVFIMTTSSEPNDRKKLEDFNISGYFIKPLAYNNNAKKNDSMDAFVQFHLRNILVGGEFER
jgi:CheY-like chemotaxis protein